MKSAVLCLVVIFVVSCIALSNAKPKPSQCGFSCGLFCPNGIVLDSRGCPSRICICKPRSCPRRYCPRVCINGYTKDKNGCNTCICKPESCRYNGKTYSHRTSFMKNCNRCLCIHGRAVCRKEACK